MKKLISLLLAMLMTLSLFACGSNSPASEPTEGSTAPQETELGPEPSEPKDYSKFAGIVEDPKGWYDAFMALPIANANMTEDELRQLCVDTFVANLTFHWTPNQEISYTYTLLNKDHEARLPIGKAYSGLCYATGISNATCGTIWKILPYYDVATGTLDVAAMGGKTLNCLSSACAYGATQGWNRIAANSGVGAMKSFNMYDSDVIPVGPYTYTPEDYNRDFGSRTASNSIIAKNGEEVMYESYAMMKMADGIYSSSSWHVQMIATAPVVVRDENGKIDPEQSYVYIHEQAQTGTRGDTLNTVQANGFELRPLGTINRKVTFKTMCEKGYIPFTLKEFVGQAPIETGKAWIGTTADTPIENGKSITPSALASKTMYTNFALCLIEVQIKNPAGETLCTYLPNLMTTPLTHEIMLTDPQLANRIKPYANGKNTVHLYARLANGELVEAFQGVLAG